MIAIDLQIAFKHPENPQLEQFERWTTAALQSVRDDAELSIRLVDKQESQQLNSQYRGKDKPTNVLSFPFDIPDGIPAEEMNHLLGDLVICSTIVEQEARAQSKNISDHWAHMVIHGTLHLLGYDHINDDDAEEMEQLERQILATLGIADPYHQEEEV